MITCFDTSPPRSPALSVRRRHGRVETYVHSDSTTPHKGAAVVLMRCDSEAGSRTAEFVTFSQKVARFAYAASARTWFDIVREFPDLSDDLRDIRKVLKETVHLESVHLLKV